MLDIYLSNKPSCYSPKDGNQKRSIVKAQFHPPSLQMYWGISTVFTTLKLHPIVQQPNNRNGTYIGKWQKAHGTLGQVWQILSFCEIKKKICLPRATIKSETIWGLKNLHRRQTYPQGYLSHVWNINCSETQSTNKEGYWVVLDVFQVEILNKNSLNVFLFQKMLIISENLLYWITLTSPGTAVFTITSDMSAWIARFWVNHLRKRQI